MDKIVKAWVQIAQWMKTVKYQGFDENSQVGSGH